MYRNDHAARSISGSSGLLRFMGNVSFDLDRTGRLFRRVVAASAAMISADLDNCKGAISLQVIVHGNNVDQALRVLKKKMQREGVFREMKRRRSYEKPSEKKTREKSEAVRRARKLARKQAIREGLIAAPPKKERIYARPAQALPRTTDSPGGHATPPPPIKAAQNSSYRPPMARS